MELITLEEFEQLLKEHDWLFEYSDDASRYKKGFKMQSKIDKILETFEDNKKFQKLNRIYNPKIGGLLYDI